MIDRKAIVVMKKNLISIVILALLTVNIVLTSIMMFSVMSTNKKTAALVGKVASAISLELGEGVNGEEEQKVVSMEDTVPYTIADMTIPLKKSEGAEDGAVNEHYALYSVTLSMDSTSKGYKKYGAELSTKEDLIRGVINDVVSQYTLEECTVNQQQIKSQILERIQTLFESDFIYEVSLIKTNYQ